MKFEYRYLSKERAAEIEKMRLRDLNGREVYGINCSKCITNEDETIIFQKIYFAHNYNVWNDYDQYLLIYKAHNYIVEMERKWRKEIEDGKTLEYFKTVVHTRIREYENCSVKEVLSVLSRVDFERGKSLSANKAKFGANMPEEPIYLGESDIKFIF